MSYSKKVRKIIERHFDEIIERLYQRYDNIIREEDDIDTVVSCFEAKSILDAMNTVDELLENFDLHTIISECNGLFDDEELEILENA